MGILALVAVILGAAYAYLDHHMDIANKSDFDKSDVTNLELSQETRDKMEEASGPSPSSAWIPGTIPPVRETSRM